MVASSFLADHFILSGFAGINFPYPEAALAIRPFGQFGSIITSVCLSKVINLWYTTFLHLVDQTYHPIDDYTIEMPLLHFVDIPASLTTTSPINRNASNYAFHKTINRTPKSERCGWESLSFSAVQVAIILKWLLTPFPVPGSESLERGRQPINKLRLLMSLIVRLKLAPFVIISIKWSSSCHLKPTIKPARLLLV